MRFRNTLLLLVIFLLLGGYTYFFEIRGKGALEEAKVEEADTIIWEMEASEIVQLDISGPDGQTRLVRKDGQSWSLIDPTTGAEMPADNDRLDRIVNSLVHLQARRVLTGTLDLAEYGLDEPKWRLDLKLQDGTKQTLQWGDPTPRKSDYYVKRNEENRVYIVAAYIIEDMEHLVREPAYAPTPTPTPTSTPGATTPSSEGTRGATPPASQE